MSQINASSQKAELLFSERKQGEVDDATVDYFTSLYNNKKYFLAQIGPDELLIPKIPISKNSYEKILKLSNINVDPTNQNKDPAASPQHNIIEYVTFIEEETLEGPQKKLLEKLLSEENDKEIDRMTKNRHQNYELRNPTCERNYYINENKDNFNDGPNNNIIDTGNGPNQYYSNNNYYSNDNDNDLQRKGRISNYGRSNPSNNIEEDDKFISESIDEGSGNINLNSMDNINVLHNLRCGRRRINVGGGDDEEEEEIENFTSFNPLNESNSISVNRSIGKMPRKGNVLYDNSITLNSVNVTLNTENDYIENNYKTTVTENVDVEIVDEKEEAVEKIKEDNNVDCCCGNIADSKNKIKEENKEEKNEKLNEIKEDKKEDEKEIKNDVKENNESKEKVDKKEKKKLNFAVISAVATFAIFVICFLIRYFGSNKDI